MTIDADSLCGDWVEVREDSRGGNVVLRPIDADLPPARGRRRLVLSPGGKLRGGSPGPDDRLRADEGGQWSFAEGKLQVTTGEWAGTYRVTDASPDRLIMVPT